MITLSDGHSFEYMTASGALGFDGKGYGWERPLGWFGLMKPRLFTVVLRTVTLEPRLYPKSNLSWIRPWTWLPWSPWSCVKFLRGGGAINKIGLYNPGFDWWYREIGPWIDPRKGPIVASIQGTEPELVEMTKHLNRFDLVAIEVNVSCPNTGHASEAVEMIVKCVKEMIVKCVKEVKAQSRHPIILKLAVGQECLAIAAPLVGVAEAISINSVPWEIACPGKKSPLWRLEKKTKGGGGVSGKPAQKDNWELVKKLADQGLIPVIAPSIMEFADMDRVRALGAQAVSFGAIHLRTP